jgi:phage baseplate assembly protein gpV
MGNGVESGVILGCVYDKKNPPAVGDRDIRVTTYEDGTSVEYDRKNHVLAINAKGIVIIEAAEGVSIKGDIRASGDISVAGNITAGGGIIDGGGNTNHHSH